MRTAVVGHVEYVEFASVRRVPRPGEIVTARRDWMEPAGGGAVAAVQLARLAGEGTLYTALGDHEIAPPPREGRQPPGRPVGAPTRAGQPPRRPFTLFHCTGHT